MSTYWYPQDQNNAPVTHSNVYVRNFPDDVDDDVLRSLFSVGCSPFYSGLQPSCKEIPHLSSESFRVFGGKLSMASRYKHTLA